MAKVHPKRSGCVTVRRAQQVMLLPPNATTNQSKKLFMSSILISTVSSGLANGCDSFAQALFVPGCPVLCGGQLKIDDVTRRVIAQLCSTAGSGEYQGVNCEDQLVSQPTSRCSSSPFASIARPMANGFRNSTKMKANHQV